MSGNKKNIKAVNEVEISGVVVLKKTAAGSKSEHTGVYIRSDQGDIALRKSGGNPFRDDSLTKLEGKNITAKGILDDKLLLAKEITTNKD